MANSKNKLIENISLVPVVEGFDDVTLCLHYILIKNLIEKKAAKNDLTALKLNNEISRLQFE